MPVAITLYGPTHALLLTLSALSAGACIPDASAASPDVTLSAMTYNIRTGTAQEDNPEDNWPNRRHRVVGIISQESPDILGLQEDHDFQIDELTDELPAYEWVGRGTDGDSGGEHNGIFYKGFKYDVLEWGTFWLSPTPDVPSTQWANPRRRTCTWARMSPERGDATFLVFNTHLDHVSQPDRRRSVGLIAQRISELRTTEPVILMGDMNAREFDPEMRYLTGDRDTAIRGGWPTPNLLNTFRAANPDAPEPDTFNSFGDSPEATMIDYVFVTRGSAVRSARVNDDLIDGRHPSDHEPVIAELVLSPFGCSPADIAGGDGAGGPDGMLTSADFLAFIGLFASDDPRADFDADGEIGSGDVLAFIDALAEGCP